MKWGLFTDDASIFESFKNWEELWNKTTNVMLEVGEWFGSNNL